MTIFHGALEKIENSKTYDLSYETFDDYSLLIGFFASEFFFNKSGPVFKEGGEEGRSIRFRPDPIYTGTMKLGLWKIFQRESDFSSEIMKNRNE